MQFGTGSNAEQRANTKIRRVKVQNDIRTSIYSRSQKKVSNSISKTVVFNRNFYRCVPYHFD